MKLCTLDVWIVSIYRKIEYLELRKLNGKLRPLYVRNIWIYRKIELCGHVECTKLRKSNGKLCTIDIQIVWI